MLILQGGRVKLKEEFEDNSVLLTHKGLEKRIVISAPKTSITAGELLTITFQWQKFNSESEAYEPDPVADPIAFQVNDLPADTLEPVDGQDTLIFSSSEPGTYLIQSTNPGMDNATLEVTVNV